MDRLLPLLCALLLCLQTASADEATAANEWLSDLQSRVADDLKKGKSMVVQVHVPLCDSSIIRCGNKRLGNGDNPDTNLYWSTSGGFKGWFKRRDRGWKKVLSTKKTGHDDVLEIRAWRKRFAPGAWRSSGVTKSFDVVVVAYAWRGKAINKAIDAYASDLYGDVPRVTTLASGETVAAGGAAHVVAYVGHNGWMDIPPYDWTRFQKKSSTTGKGTIAVACMTADYLADPITDPRRVPLLMTTSLMFAGAHSFEGAVSAFAKKKGLAAIRRNAAKNHGIGQDKELRRVHGAFTNPSDRRWRRYRPTGN
jgi:hypothetical protein